MDIKKKIRPNGSATKFKCRLVVVGYGALIAFVAIHDLLIHQMNVNTTLLNGYLEEEIYMTQPEGFIKQALKQWYEKFNITLVNSYGTCVYS